MWLSNVEGPCFNSQCYSSTHPPPTVCLWCCYLCVCVGGTDSRIQTQEAHWRSTEGQFKAPSLCALGCSFHRSQGDNHPPPYLGTLPESKTCRPAWRDPESIWEEAIKCVGISISLRALRSSLSVLRPSATWFYIFHTLVSWSANGDSHNTHRVSSVSWRVQFLRRVLMCNVFSGDEGWG